MFTNLNCCFSPKPPLTWSLFFCPIPTGLTDLLSLTWVLAIFWFWLACFPLLCVFVCEINKLFNFFEALFNTTGTFSLSMLFFKNPAIILTICRIVSVTNLLVSFRPSWELIVPTRVWNINRNLWTLCSLISISSFISLIFPSIFWFSNLIFFLSWFSESSYSNSELKLSILVSSIDLSDILILISNKN